MDISVKINFKGKLDIFLKNYSYLTLIPILLALNCSEPLRKQVGRIESQLSLLHTTAEQLSFKERRKMALFIF